MRFAFSTLPAEFLERPNRFLVRARLLASGQEARVHCPDPGRLRELLVPGVRVHVSPETGPGRSTTHCLRFVEHPETGILVSLDSNLACRLFREGLEEGFFPSFRGWLALRAEAASPDCRGRVRTRFDFRLEMDSGRPCWVEVKSATLVEEGIAAFPDAVTLRGRRHLEELAARAAAGDRAAVCFVVQRPDAWALRPQWERDPAFARALVEAARAGVELHACTARLTLQEARLDRLVPVLTSCVP